MTKAESLLMTNKECLAIVEDSLRNYFYFIASPEDTKLKIEQQVDWQMLNLKAKEARKVVAMGVHNLSLSPKDRQTIIQLIQQAKKA